jgi:hypothetical protein
MCAFARQAFAGDREIRKPAAVDMLWKREFTSTRDAIRLSHKYLGCADKDITCTPSFLLAACSN